MADVGRVSIFSLKNNIRRFFVSPDSQTRALDGFRALSILYVVIFHAFYLPQPAFAQVAGFVSFVESMPAYLNWVWHGDAGVDMFFILSGFLIAGLMIREQQASGRVRVGRFYGHRALRILPVYLFAILVASLPATSNAEYFWANLLFINNFLPIEKILIPWSWSLSIEVQFYLLFPLLFVLLSRSTRPLLWLLGLFIGATAIRYAVILAYPELYQQPFFNHVVATDTRPTLMFEKVYINLYTRMGPLLLGVLMAYLYHGHQAGIRAWLQSHQRLANLLLIAAVILVVGVTAEAVFNPNIVRSSAFNLHYMAWYRNLFALGMAVILFMALLGIGWGALLQRLLSLRFWYPIAQSAYSTYLFHIPFLAVAYYLVLDGQVDGLQHLALADVWTTAALALMLSLCFSLLIYLFIERPFMNLYKRRQTK